MQSRLPNPRPQVPTRLLEFLQASQVPYKLIHHPVAYTAQELAAIENVKGRQHAKVVIATAGGKPLMLVLPADHRIDLARLGQQLGQPVQLATETQFAAWFADCAAGTMPPFGHLYGLETLLDPSLASDGPVVFEAGTHTDAVRMRYADYERLAVARVCDFATKGQ